MMEQKGNIIPIVAYGDSVLRAKTQKVQPSYPNLEQLIDDMFATMYAAPGVGLAAPQVGLSIKLLVIDASSYNEEGGKQAAKDFKRTLINPLILEESGNEWAFEEGCLSVPGIREEVIRKSRIRIRYYDSFFNMIEEEYDDIIARIIQHEYDHLEGILFPDRLNPLKRRLLKRKLNDISYGNIEVSYPMRFPKKKKRRSSKTG